MLTEQELERSQKKLKKELKELSEQELVELMNDIDGWRIARFVKQNINHNSIEVDRELLEFVTLEVDNILNIHEMTAQYEQKSGQEWLYTYQPGKETLFSFVDETLNYWELKEKLN